MRIDIISAVPSLLISPFADSILKRAQDKGLVEVVVHDLRHYTTNKHKKIDDYAFGGGAGMVMTIQPIDACISKLKNQRDYDEVIYMTPDGEQLNQQICNKLSSITNMIILCGHYKGIDERVRKLFITREISIGDYVRPGQTVQFHIRDHESASAELTQLLKNQTANQAPKAAMLFTCNGRGLNLFQDPNHDAACIQAVAPIPLAGFFAAGEIGPVGEKNFLHGFTASVVLFD